MHKSVTFKTTSSCDHIIEAEHTFSRRLEATVKEQGCYYWYIPFPLQTTVLKVCNFNIFPVL